MAGRGRAGRGGNAGCGDTSNSGCSSRGGHGSMQTNSMRTGLNKELEDNIFNLREKSSADLMRMM